MPAFLTDWSFEPAVLLGLVFVGTAYARGLQLLHRRGRLWRTVGRRHIASFALGLFTIVLALESPIDALSNDLFSIHMAQHLLLLMVAPPLLLLGKPFPVLLVGAPHDLVHEATLLHARTPWLRGLTRWLVSPVVAWAVYIGDFFLWHLPVLYQLALQYESVHVLEHLCFLSTALLFWWVVIEPLPGPPRRHYALRMLYVWLPTFPNTALGAVFALTSSPWYPIYALRPRPWNISVIDDQHLGGVVMWFGGGMMYVLAAAVLFFAMLAADERSPMNALDADDAPELPELPEPEEANTIAMS